MNAHEIAKIEALVRFHFKVNPDELDDDELGKLWGQLRYALEIEKMRTGLQNLNL